MDVDLSDTTNCPLGDVCASCRLPVPDRRVWTAGSQVGVMCLTLCDACQVFGAPRMGLPEAVRAVMRHCEHLGATIDEMAQILEAETGAMKNMHTTRAVSCGRTVYKAGEAPTTCDLDRPCPVHGDPAELAYERAIDRAVREHARRASYGGEGRDL